MSEKLKEYIQERKKNPLGEYHLGDITVYVKEPLPPTVDLKKVLNFISSNLPAKFYSNVDIIYIR